MYFSKKLKMIEFSRIIRKWIKGKTYTKSKPFSPFLFTQLHSFAANIFRLTMSLSYAFDANQLGIVFTVKKQIFVIFIP